MTRGQETRSLPPAKNGRTRLFLRGGLGLRLRPGGLVLGGRGLLGRARLCVRGRLRQPGERRRRRHRELREALAIERVARRLQPGDQLAVSEPVLACRRVDPHHPQAAEVALLVAAADERVLQRRVDRLLGRAIELALGLVEPLRAAQELLALRAADVSSFYSRHDLKPSTAASGGASPCPGATPLSSPSACACGCAPCWSGCAP